MKKYAIAYIDWFDYDLKINFVEANSELEALYKGADLNGIEMRNNISSIDDFQQECFNMDSMMSAKEVL